MGACVLLGTGIGIAFFMWMAHRTADAAIIAATARIVVVADAVFTATAVVIAARDRRGAGLAVMGFPLGDTVDRLVDRALCARRRVLAAGGVDPDQAA